MSEWDKHFADLKAKGESKREAEKAASLQRDEVDRLARAESERILNEVVMPIFHDVATSAKKNGFDAKAEPTMARGQLAQGAKLSIARRNAPEGSPLGAQLSRLGGGLFEITYSSNGYFAYKIVGNGEVSSSIQASALTEEWVKNELRPMLAAVLV